MKKIIILDTNFLLIPAQFNVDIFSEIERICDFPYQLCIVDKTLSELDSIIENQRQKYKNSAKLALKLLKSKAVKIIKTKKDKYVDDLIFDLAENADIIIATQDKELKKRLKNPIITLRQKKYLKILKICQ